MALRPHFPPPFPTPCTPSPPQTARTPRSLAPLVRKLHDEYVDQIMAELSTTILTSKDGQRDVRRCAFQHASCVVPQTLKC